MPSLHRNLHCPLNPLGSSQKFISWQPPLHTHTTHLPLYTHLSVINLHISDGMYHHSTAVAITNDMCWASIPAVTTTPSDKGSVGEGHCVQLEEKIITKREEFIYWGSSHLAGSSLPTHQYTHRETHSNSGRKRLPSGCLYYHWFQECSYPPTLSEAKVIEATHWGSEWCTHTHGHSIEADVDISQRQQTNEFSTIGHHLMETLEV